MKIDEPARRAVFSLAAVLVLAGGALRMHQAWSHRGVYLPVSMHEEGYFEAAIGLLSYQTFSIGVPNATPRAWRGPLFPVFIALIESLSSEPDAGRIRLAQAGLATFAILLVFTLGWVIYSPAAGLLAAALLAFNAEHAAAVTSLNIHGFYSFLLLTACAALLLWSESPTPKSTFMAGVFMGLTLLCRSSHFLLVPFMTAAAWFWRPLPGARWRAPALLLLGAILALAPMIARNRVVTGRWLLFPDAYGGAVALFGATTGRQGLMSYSVEHARELAEAAEPGFTKSALADDEFHAAILDLAVRRILADPLRFAGLCLRRLGLLIRAQWLPLILGLAGLAFQRRNRRLQIAIIMALSFGSYCVAGGAPEHQSAAVPLLFLLAGCGGAILLGRLAGSAPPMTVATRAWQRRILAAGPIFGLTLYAACLLALAVEARQRLWRGDAPAFAMEDRALALLRIQAAQGTAPARRAYSDSLSRNGVRWAEAGGCSAAAPRLRRSLLLEPRQHDIAGTLAACLAAESGAAEARALASRYRSRPRKERDEFWNAAIQQSERMGVKAAMWLLALHPSPDGAARERIVSLWLKRADASARAGARDAALDALAQIEKLHPSASERLVLIGYYRELKEYRRASASLETLSRLRPRDAAVWIDLAELAVKMGHPDAVRSPLARAEGLDLTENQRLLMYKLYWDLHEYARALAILKPLLRHHPKDASLWLKCAELESQTDARDAALQSLSTAESLGTLTWEERRRVVSLYRHLKDPRRGDAALEPLIERAPKDPVLWLERAEFKSQAGERDAALAALAHAERLDALPTDRRRLAVELYRELKEPRRGAAALKPLLELEPLEAGLWIDSAEFSAQAGKRDEALASLARADKLSPEGADRDGERRRRLAQSYQALGEYGRAIAILDSLTRRFPSEGKFHGDKGLCEYLNGNAPEAIASLQTAIRLDAKFIPAYLSLGAIHAAKSRPEDALKVYGDGLKHVPESERSPLRDVLLNEFNALRRKTAARP